MKVKRVANLTSFFNIVEAHITIIWVEKAKFDTQQMQNPEMSGVEYHKGELYGYQVREYLLEKWGRECTYCSKKSVPLQIEYIHLLSKGGSNRVSNLCLACEKCNQIKGNKPITPNNYYCSNFNTAINASWGTSTVPIAFIRFLPLACFCSNFFFREISPP